MPWIRLDERFHDHPKTAVLGDFAPLARDLFVAGIGYCNEHLTDGLIPKAQIKRLFNYDVAVLCGAEWVPVTGKMLSEKLIEAGLWEDAGTHFIIHDYLDYQPSKEEVLNERAARSEAARQAGVRSGQARRTKSERRTNADTNETRTKSERRTNADTNETRTKSERRTNSVPDPVTDPGTGSVTETGGGEPPVPPSGLAAGASSGAPGDVPDAPGATGDPPAPASGAEGPVGTREAMAPPDVPPAPDFEVVPPRRPLRGLHAMAKQQLIEAWEAAGDGALRGKIGSTWDIEQFARAHHSDATLAEALAAIPRFAASVATGEAPPMNLGTFLGGNYRRPDFRRSGPGPPKKGNGKLTPDEIIAQALNGIREGT